LLSGFFSGISIRAPIVECILPKVDGIQKDEQAATETIVAPSRQMADSKARKVTLQDVNIMATLPGRPKKAGEARTKINTDEETGDITAA
jgi:5'-phosphate synthase pdxT subunit